MSFIWVFTLGTKHTLYGYLKGCNLILLKNHKHIMSSSNCSINKMQDKYKMVLIFLVVKFFSS